MTRYELDSAEQIMCDLYNTNLVSTPTNVIEMNHDVLEDGLYYAAQQAMKQHPYFATKMVKDGLTVYMEENDLPFVIKKPA